MTPGQSVDSLPGAVGAGVGVGAGAGGELALHPTYTHTPPRSLSRRASGQLRERDRERERERTTTPELFERLVAGQESEEGEAPPSYEVAVEAAVLSPAVSVLGH